MTGLELLRAADTTADEIAKREGAVRRTDGPGRGRAASQPRRDVRQRAQKGIPQPSRPCGLQFGPY